MCCKNCRKQLPAEAIMCPECGTPTKPLTIMPTAQKDKTATTAKETVQIISLSGAIGFFLSMVAFITSIVFGAFIYALENSALIYLISSTSITPALVGVSFGLYA